MFDYSFGANSNFFLNLPSGANVIELAPPMDSMNVTGPFAVASGLILDRSLAQQTTHQEYQKLIKITSLTAVWLLMNSVPLTSQSQI